MTTQRDQQIKRQLRVLAWSENDLRHYCVEMFGKAYENLTDQETIELLHALRNDPDSTYTW